MGKQRQELETNLSESDAQLKEMGKKVRHVRTKLTTANRAAEEALGLLVNNGLCTRKELDDLDQAAEDGKITPLEPEEKTENGLLFLAVHHRHAADNGDDGEGGEELSESVGRLQGGFKDVAKKLILSNKYTAKLEEAYVLECYARNLDVNESAGWEVDASSSWDGKVIAHACPAGAARAIMESEVLRTSEDKMELLWGCMLLQYAVTHTFNRHWLSMVNPADAGDFCKMGLFLTFPGGKAYKQMSSRTWYPHGQRCHCSPQDIPCGIDDFVRASDYADPDEAIHMARSNGKMLYVELDFKDIVIEKFGSGVLLTPSTKISIWDKISTDIIAAWDDGTTQRPMRDRSRDYPPFIDAYLAARWNSATARYNLDLGEGVDGVFAKGFMWGFRTHLTRTYGKNPSLVGSAHDAKVARITESGILCGWFVECLRASRRALPKLIAESSDGCTEYSIHGPKNDGRGVIWRTVSVIPCHVFPGEKETTRMVDVDKDTLMHDCLVVMKDAGVPPSEIIIKGLTRTKHGQYIIGRDPLMTKYLQVGSLPAAPIQVINAIVEIGEHLAIPPSNPFFAYFLEEKAEYEESIDVTDEERKIFDVGFNSVAHAKYSLDMGRILDIPIGSAANVPAERSLLVSDITAHVWEVQIIDENTQLEIIFLKEGDQVTFRYNEADAESYALTEVKMVDFISPGKEITHLRMRTKASDLEDIDGRRGRSLARWARAVGEARSVMYEFSDQIEDYNGKSWEVTHQYMAIPGDPSDTELLWLRRTVWKDVLYYITPCNRFSRGAPAESREGHAMEVWSRAVREDTTE